MAGLWFEEFTDGMVFNHEWSRTITETDNVWFSLLTMNVQPLHIDAHYAAKSEWGKPLVNSLFTLGLVVGLSVHELTLGTTVANLGFTRVDFPAPVFAGDTIHVVTDVIEARRSRSRPGTGIVTFEHRGLNQRDETVCIAVRAAMMLCEPDQGRPAGS
jgi:acyl dehydratase